MVISPKEKSIKLLGQVIVPTLTYLQLNSESAIRLVLGTAIMESLLRYRNQFGGGPAKGLWQMEPNTYYDIWNNYLAYKPELRSRISKLYTGKQVPDSEALVNNDELACAMCRIHYLRVPSKLPSATDLKAQAGYWKKYYNTYKGKGTIKQYMEYWNIFIDEKQLENTLNEIT